MSQDIGDETCIRTSVTVSGGLGGDTSPGWSARTGGGSACPVSKNEPVDPGVATRHDDRRTPVPGRRLRRCLQHRTRPPGATRPDHVTTSVGCHAGRRAAPTQTSRCQPLPAAASVNAPAGARAPGSREVTVQPYGYVYLHGITFQIAKQRAWQTIHAAREVTSVVFGLCLTWR